MIRNGLYSIGELAKRTGVAVKTIRHYTDEGVLPASGVTEGGYRQYSDGDLQRLLRVRSLRALGFSLAAIASMLDGSRDARDVARLQLDLTEAQLRGLERQRAILAAAVAGDDRDLPARLDAAYAAASLGAAERALRLDRWLERTTTVDPGDEARARLRGMVLDDLPAELSNEQLAAWVCLSALLDDDDFAAVLAEQHAPFAGAPPEAVGRFGSEVWAIVRDATALVQDGAPENDPRLLECARRWEAAFASALGRTGDSEFRQWFVAYAQRTNDARIETFWRDLAALRATPGQPGGSGTGPFYEAQRRMIAALAASESPGSRRDDRGA